MQKVEGSNLFSRLHRKPRYGGAFSAPGTNPVDRSRLMGRPPRLHPCSPESRALSRGRRQDRHRVVPVLETAFLQTRNRGGAGVNLAAAGDGGRELSVVRQAADATESGAIPKQAPHLLVGRR